MASCPSCGLEFATGERFCPNDGSRLDAGDLAATAPIGPDPLIGRVLDGRYKIDRKLGEGGMGAVYRAVHTGMDKVVAVKILRGAMSRDEIAAKRFQREAKSTSRLDHEHCVRVTDFGHTEDGLLFLAMEYLEGKTLGEELFQLGPVSASRAVNIARQVCLALAHAHDLGIIHRDLKPDNVFLTVKEGRNDFVKVLDFGLAKLLEREPEIGPDGRAGSISTLTEAGTVFGTPEYMSPEQAEGKPLDPRTDLYSLGVVMYQMVTGQLPFQAPSFIAILTKHLTEVPVSPVDRRPDLGIPASLSALIMRCLEKEPAMRPPGARSLAQELDRLDLTTPSFAGRVPRQIAAAPTINVPPVVSGPGAMTIPMPEPLADALIRNERAEPTAPVYVGDLSATDLPPTHGRRVLLWIAAPLVAAAIALVVFVGRGGSHGAAAVTPPDAAPLADAPRAAAPPDAAVAAAVERDAGASAPPIIRRDPVGDALKEAARAHKEGNTIKEIAALQQAVKLAPNNTDALVQLGTLLLAAQHDRGCDYLKRALRDRRAKELYDKECSLVTP